MYISRAYGSSVVRLKESYVPRPPGLFLKTVCVFSNVNEVV